MTRITTFGIMLLLCGNALYAGSVNLSPSASGSLALDETVAGGDSTTTDNFPGGEAPGFALDNDLGTKYLQFGGPDGSAANTGILVFFDNPVVVDGMLFGFGNDAPERDPWYYTLEGSNAVNQATYGTTPGTIADGPAWTPILVDPNSPTGLVNASDTFLDAFAARSTYSTDAPFFRSAASFTNTTAYSAYRVLFTDLRLPIDIMQVSEIQLLGVPEPAAFSLIGLGFCGLLMLRRNK